MCVGGVVGCGGKNIYIFLLPLALSKPPRHSGDKRALTRQAGGLFFASPTRITSKKSAKK